ncbi:hypothetical protein BLNAU_17467 [Blattamonas nauphoetae]|uniref:Uncharacterized protein n=1 Tax=Blattamonas nauphoetae TaxID=2049346 RepID=A0ABQ9X9S9_9EUKA|nr:hypothetical protein BLNAU_17467 [Blattamonas nauphoetae]
MDNSEHLSFSHVYFVGNSIGNDTTFFPLITSFPENGTKFVDVAIMSISFPHPCPTLKFDDCFTSNSSDSTGMIVGRTQLETVRVNEETGKIELEMKGKTPPISQEYEVTVKNSDGMETRFRMLFLDGKGTLVSGSEDNLEYNTSYTITSIVGVIPPSSSSRLTNDIAVPVAAWAFNLAVTPDFIAFTTPNAPTITTPQTPSFSTLQIATAHLIESDTQSAFVVMVFDKEVCGSFDFVVLEEGKPVTLTITSETSSKSGATKEFKVIGDGKLLTHDTTYTIKSLTPTPNTDSQTDMRMDGIVSFHIPKSSSDNKSRLPPETKKLLSWLLPLVGCLLIALVVVIIVIVLLRSRKQKSAGPTQNEMEAQEPLEVEKVEEFGVDCSNRVIRTDGNEHSAFDSPEANISGKKDTDQQKGSQFGEVIVCHGGFEISAAPMTDTLYSVLHKEH